MKLYKQQILVETLLKFRLKKYNFNKIKVECYDRFDGDTIKCRLEVFKGGTGIKNRIMKHEAPLDENFVKEAENRLREIYSKK